MFIRWWGSTAYALPFVSRRSNTIGGFRSLCSGEFWFSERSDFKLFALFRRKGENFSSNTSAKLQHECKVVTRAVKTIRPLRLLKCEVHFFQDRCFFFLFHSDLGRLFRAQNEELILLYSESNEV